MYTENDFDIVKNIIISNIPDIYKIIIFGSYARGDFNFESDLDFLVITEHDFERKEKLAIISKLRWDIADNGYDADVIIKSRLSYESETGIPTLSRVIQKEGVSLWTRV